MASQLPNFEARNTNPSDFDTDIIAVYQDSAKKALAPKGAYAAQVERLRKADAFSARQGAVHFVRFGATGAGDNVLFAGCGEVGDVTEEKLRIAGGAVWARLVAEKSRSAVVQVGSF
ncbi:MAG: M17 family peptidase N-terminal domain-containing protein, partial [Bdellovibrionota bacterium]